MVSNPWLTQPLSNSRSCPEKAVVTPGRQPGGHFFLCSYPILFPKALHFFQDVYATFEPCVWPNHHQGHWFETCLRDSCPLLGVIVFLQPCAVRTLERFPKFGETKVVRSPLKALCSWAQWLRPVILSLRQRDCYEFKDRLGQRAATATMQTWVLV